MIGQEPIFGVSDFVAVFNQTVSSTYPRIGVQGEVANFRVSRNQWVYFDLKDEHSSVKFFGSTRQLPGPVQDGMIVEVHGSPRLHNNYGFSVNFDSIKPIGQGSIKKAQELLAAKLSAEGLFDIDRKRPLPFAPDRIGIVTAERSAAFADFIKIAQARWPFTEIVFMDVKVQGDSSPAQVVSAIKAMNESASPPELLAIFRGGGSPEDLGSFSDERVVRAVASSRIPTVVAIGHESDISLAEMAADVRASTPSNSAELIFPDVDNERRMLMVSAKRLDESKKSIFNHQTEYIKQKVTIIDSRVQQVITDEINIMNHHRRLLGLLNPKEPLKRGYSIVREASGKTVRSAKQLSSSQEISIEFADGSINGKVQ